MIMFKSAAGRLAAGIIKHRYHKAMVLYRPPALTAGGLLHSRPVMGQKPLRKQIIFDYYRLLTYFYDMLQLKRTNDQFVSTGKPDRIR